MDNSQDNSLEANKKNNELGEQSLNNSEDITVEEENQAITTSTEESTNQQKESSSQETEVSKEDELKPTTWQEIIFSFFTKVLTYLSWKRLISLVSIVLWIAFAFVVMASLGRWVSSFQANAEPMYSEVRIVQVAQSELDINQINFVAKKYKIFLKILKNFK